MGIIDVEGAQRETSLLLVEDAKAMKDVFEEYFLYLLGVET